MKLIVRDYLCSIKEDGELDDLLVALLLQMGLSIQGGPKKGVAQSGVDLWAVGRIPPDEEDRVYLVSVKRGNLTRTVWDTGTQALRPSLDQIVDDFIPHRIPKSFAALKKSVCVAIGGEVESNVQPSVDGYLEYLESHHDVATRKLTGDDIAGLICDHLLSASVLRGEGQRPLFQALAMVQEPEASLGPFRQLIASLFTNEPKNISDWMKQGRTGILCLALLDHYCQDANNLEASSIGSEFFRLALADYAERATVLPDYSETKTKKVIHSSIQLAKRIQERYFAKLEPLVRGKYHLSLAVPGDSILNTNLRLFDLLGRVASFGLACVEWAQGGNVPEKSENGEQDSITLVERMRCFVHEMIKNNPALQYPVRDDFCIEVSLTALFLLSTNDLKVLHWWLAHMVDNLHSCLRVGKPFMCVFCDYRRLAEFCHAPRDYVKTALPSSEMIPTLAVISLSLGFVDIYRQLCELVRRFLPTTNLQLWYPDDADEKQFIVNGSEHGKELVSLPLDDPKRLLEMTLRECSESPFSSSRFPSWNVLSSCRLYRKPLPIHYWRPLLETIPVDRLSTILMTGQTNLD